MSIIRSFAALYVLCIVLCNAAISYAHASFDLDTWMEDFVIKTKQIIVPGYCGAFNASVIRWEGRLLLCFRVRDENMVSTFEIGFIELDNDFNAIGKAHILEVRYEDPTCLQRKQDPRLIIVHNKLHILYSEFIKIDDIITRRMFIAEVQREGDTFFIDAPVCLHPFEGWSKRWEKNWVPFVYHDTLHLAYSVVPHRIMEPLLPRGECVTRHATLSSMAWDWGDPRGGTPAIKDGDEYIAFFHSSRLMTTSYSGNVKMTHYVMGAYTFSAEPPFEIRRMSAHPIVGPGFYAGPTYNTWKPLRVVFPMGLLIEGDTVWVTYGRQDFEIWVAQIDKNALYKSLVPREKISEHAAYLKSEGQEMSMIHNRSYERFLWKMFL